MSGKAELNKTTEVKDERVFTLSRPFEFEGETYTELLLDFDKLSGNDLNDAIREMKATGYLSAQDVIPLMEMHKPYQAFVAAKAADVFPGLIFALPAKDFSKITTRAMVFLNV